MFMHLGNRNSVRRLLPSLMVVVLLMQLFALPAKAFADTGINKNVFGPWVNQSVPFDGRIQEANQSTSEGLNFTCPIPPRDVVLLFQVYAQAFSKSGKDFKYQTYRGSSGYLRWAKEKFPGLRPWIVVVNNENQLKAKVMHGNTAGCFSNNKVEQDLEVSIKDILHPVDFFTKLLGGIFSAPLIFLVNLMQPVVFRSLFTTPHTERGDSIFDNYSQDSKKLSTCDGGPCGFQKANLTEANQQSNFWISLSMTLRSLLSATYGLIIVGVALIYMYRQNVRSAYNIKKVLPRVIASVALMIMFPFVMGLIITTGNFFVQSVFGTGPADSMNGLNEVINNIINFKSDTDIVGPGGGVAIWAHGTVQTMISVLILAAVTFFMAILFCLTIIKQVALIFVVIFAPIACLAYVIEKWTHITTWWFRCLIAITAIPVVQAIILKVGYTTASGVYGDGDIASKAFAAFILIVMFWMMTKVLSWIFRWIGSTPFGLPGPQEVHGGAKKAIGGGMQAAGLIGAAAAGGPVGLAAANAMGGAGSSMSSGKGSILGGGVRGASRSAMPGGVSGKLAGMLGKGSEGVEGVEGVAGTVAGEGEEIAGVSGVARVAGAAAGRGKSKNSITPQLGEADGVSNPASTRDAGAGADEIRGVSGKTFAEETSSSDSDVLRSIDSKIGALGNEGGTGAPPGHVTRPSGIIVPEGSAQGPASGVAPSGPQRAQGGQPMPSVAQPQGIPGGSATPGNGDNLGERKLERQRSAKDNVAPAPADKVDNKGTPKP